MSWKSPIDTLPPVESSALLRLASAGAAAFAWLLASSLAAQTYQVLHSFGRASSSGILQRSALIADASGNLYGATSVYQPSLFGTIFKLDASNNYAPKTLHSFSGPDGAGSVAALFADASGNLYGTTSGVSDSSQYGTVFKLDASNNYALTTLHSFSGPDGAFPRAAVIGDGSGNLYGTTGRGGPSDFGTVFKLDASNNYALTTLHRFSGLDGAYPGAAVIADASGNLYGTTAYGGTFDSGTVFKLDASNSFAPNVLHSFSGTDGKYPGAAVIADASGNLYGTTGGGGSSDSGTVFKLDASNNYALTTLHGFSGPDGAYPGAAVIADASGNLYGTTIVAGPSLGGTAFRLDAANDYALTTLHDFDNLEDGRNPSAGVIADASGNLYGTTRLGGLGTVFRLDAANNYALTTLHYFNGLDGEDPVAALVADAWGNLYGTTSRGGPGGFGTVFKLDASNNYALTTLHTFDGLYGRYPIASVLVDLSGNIFGTTLGDGIADFGTVFRLDASNNYALTTLHTFDGFDGGYPYGAVIADASGSLYGTTQGGGSFGYGVVFKLEAANNYALTTLHSFDGVDGKQPVAPLIADASGNLYGTTGGDGISDSGTVFRLDASNGYALTTLHSFDGSDGSGPRAAVIADSAGNLYGTTLLGGPILPDTGGTVFKLDAANGYALTLLHAFNPFFGTGGDSPFAALFADTSGNLFGTSYQGGVNGTGVVFSLTIGEPAPVTGITPTSGPSAGGTAVTITGASFSPTASIWIGGAPASGVAVVGPTEITAVTPPLPPGRLNDVAVTNALNGPSASRALSGAFFSDFLDVPQADIFHADVEKVFRSGITAGCGGGQYCRNSPVSRAQMAVLLLKGEHGAGYVPPICAGIFGDVPCPSQYAAWIEQLSAEGITAGCGSGNYCPGSSVTRAQMAVFLLKSEHGSSYAPPACVGIFGDVLCPSLYADWIEQLSSEGITGGCGGGNYCPAGPVTRGQMAVFLTGTFDLP